MLPSGIEEWSASRSRERAKERVERPWQRKANRDFAGDAPGCQTDLLSACQALGNTRSKARPKEIRGRHFGLWLSLVERLVRDQEAVGSNPTSPIIFIRHRFSSKFRECSE
jgi:hypothetical protein